MAKKILVLDYIILTVSNMHKVKSHIRPPAPFHLISLCQTNPMTDRWVVTYSKNKAVLTLCRSPVPAYLSDTPHFPCVIIKSHSPYPHTQNDSASGLWHVTVKTLSIPILHK